MLKRDVSSANLSSLWPNRLDQGENRTKNSMVDVVSTDNSKIIECVALKAEIKKSTLTGSSMFLFRRLWFYGSGASEICVQKKLNLDEAVGVELYSITQGNSLAFNHFYFD